MKQMSLRCCALALAAFFAVFGCGGGGGGSSNNNSSNDDGGGSGKGGTYPLTTYSGLAGDAERRTPELSTVDQVASALVSPNSRIDVKSGTDYFIGPSCFGKRYALQILSDKRVGMRLLGESGGYTAIFDSDKMSFHKMNGVNFAVMFDDDFKPFLGGIKESQALWLGKLDYATFGYWIRVWDFREPYPSRTAPVEVYDRAFFYKGSTSQYSGNKLSFTGIAAGVVESQKYGPWNVLGTASLDIESSSKGTLVLNFPDFYKFTGSVATNKDGELSGRFTGMEQLGSVYKGYMPTNVSGFIENGIDGRLYGKDSNSPSEAAGTAGFSAAGGGDGTIFNSVFGVKKK